VSLVIEKKRFVFTFYFFPLVAADEGQLPASARLIRARPAWALPIEAPPA
jgi:hypothetical protein